MSSRTKIQEAARRVKPATDHGEKLNAIADAIHEFVDYIELIERLFAAPSLIAP
ncbi:MAG TPA: hypothetical protein VHY10_09215 [Xanthobacteraceae bacterium]|jgi:hypothetical protein|nr:hypothetical protein [Xanthobacteraceae bacterium]